MSTLDFNTSYIKEALIKFGLIFDMHYAEMIYEIGASI